MSMEFESQVTPATTQRCRTCPKHCKECDDILAAEKALSKETHNNCVSPHHSSHTLCWCCKKSVTGGCNWIDKKQPVDHWEATPTDRGMFHSYHVLDCPEFERG